ncbi:dTDP-4-dehydrorhamnose reductase family protein [Pseudorhizobium flavum]|uniref:dTDP-4-dehydrorhamnose reductase family protein n=1 Tax=Pseudorhizobium flavum TaxID=1335061 RepID=UPI00376FE7D0
MTKETTLVIGASGMLGSEVFRALAGKSDHCVFASVRNSSALQYFDAEYHNKIATNVDVLDNDALISLLNWSKPTTVVNCVGLIKQLPASKDPLVALPINAMFPHRLARLAALVGARLIHVSTDCVFSGSKGGYTEDCEPDSSDLYGVSKRLGEVLDVENAVTLRTSIIGRELNSAHSLVEWFLAQHGEVMGFKHAIFSGLPTCELASVIRDVVIPHKELNGLYHVSAEPISKFELLQLIASEYGKDIRILPDERTVIDRSLNSARFSCATGYVAPPWPELIKRMHRNERMGGPADV